MNGPRALAFARTDWTQRYKLRQIAAANQHSHHFVGLKRADNRFKLPRIADIRIAYAQDNIAALYARARGWFHLSDQARQTRCALSRLANQAQKNTARLQTCSFSRPAKFNAAQPRA